MYACALRRSFWLSDASLYALASNAYVNNAVVGIHKLCSRLSNVLECIRDCKVQKAACTERGNLY